MRSTLAAAWAVLTLLASACSGGGGIVVVLDEYSLETAADAEGGRVIFDVRNAGEIEHEFDVLRTDRRPDDLPILDAQARTKSGDVDLVRKTNRIRPGSSVTLVVRLRPGAYVLICNVPGHYQSGMRTPLLVR